MFVALAEVFYTNAVDVGSISGSCDVYLASVDEALKVFFVGGGPGLYWGRHNVHGPRADCGIIFCQ